MFRLPKAKTVFLLVSKPSDAPNLDAPNLKGNNVWHSCFFWSLVLWVYSYCLRFPFDCAPHVRPVPLIQLFSLELSTHGNCQSRHLEEEDDYNCDRNWRLGNQRFIPDTR